MRRVTVGLLCLLGACEAEVVEEPVGFGCDFEGRCPGDLRCAPDFTCQRPAPTCESPLSACGARCVDLRTSSADCGTCGTTCRSNERCVEGTCTPSGNMTCTFCGPGVACFNGVCDCQGRGSLCSGYFCLDLQQAKVSCGACFSPCTNLGERCVAGACVCPPNERVCDNQCTKVLTDASHCGACGTTCAAGQVCEAGRCVAQCTQPQNCGSASCFDIATDRDHCGPSCLRCADGATCVQGACTCPLGTSSCRGACIDFLRDAENCGACGTTCAPGEWCSAGACACQPGLTRCNGACVDLSDDGQHCGACGSACAPGQLCSRGACVTACPLGVEACTNERSCRSGVDPNRCGGCTTQCSAGERCVDDDCVTARPAVSCTSCPCEECDDLLCCIAAGKPTCVDGMRCPQ